MKKRLLAWLLTAALAVGLVPATAVSAMAAELSGVYTLSDDYISVSVSKSNGGFTIRTVEGDRLKKSDNDKDLLYHDGQYDTSFLSFRVGTEGVDAKDYIFGGTYRDNSGAVISSAVSVTEENSAIKAVWSVDGLTFTQSVSLTNTSSNESGMVSLSVSVENNSGEAVPVKARILYDTALGDQDFGYYQYTGTNASNLGETVTIKQEKVLDQTQGDFIPAQMFAADDPVSPSIVAYTVSSSSATPYQAAFGHWSHLASTLFDFTADGTLDFTNTRSEYMTADSACALYFDLGSVGTGESGAKSLDTFYGVYSNHKTPASDSVAVNLTAPVRLTLNEQKDGFETVGKGIANFAVSVTFTNIDGENAQDLNNLVLAVSSSRNLRSLNDNGEEDSKQGFETTDTFNMFYDELKVGESKTKNLYFQARPGTEATYESITIGVYQRDANGQFSESNKLGERTTYVLLPGTENDVPQVNFAAMTPKIIYNEGTRHLFVTVDNASMLANTAHWNLMAWSEDGKVSKEIPHENITFKDGIMDVALKDENRLSEGGWYLQLEWTQLAVDEGLVTNGTRLQTGPELHFTVSADKKYKNDAYGVVAVVERIVNNSGTLSSRYSIERFGDEAGFEVFKKNTAAYEEILLVFKGEFIHKTDSNGRNHYLASSTKTMIDGKPSVDNPVVINGCMDFEGGSLEVYEDGEGAICTEFDGDIYTNTERTSIWKGKAIFTKIEQGKKYSLVPYNENGVRADYTTGPNGEKMLKLNEAKSYEYEAISLIWPFADGIGQTISGMIFKLAYGQLGVMYQTEQTNTDGVYAIKSTLGRVLSFTASLDKTFARGKVDPDKLEPPTYWSELRELWFDYNPSKKGGLYDHIYRGGNYEDAWGHMTNLNDYDSLDNDKSIHAAVMVRDVLFGCGQGFVGVNFNVGIGIKNYISGLPDIEGTIAVNTVNNWSVNIDGSVKLATFAVEAKVSFKSKDNIPIPDELYVFVSGFHPGINIDGLGVVWITGGGGGIKNLYDTIFLTQSVPPLKLLMSVSFDLLKVLYCEKATLSLGLTGIGLQAQGIEILGADGLTAISRMGLSLEWYPGIDARANITLNLLSGLITGGGYLVLISPDYKDVFFEMFARAAVNIPPSIPFVGGMQLANVDLGLSSEKVWGAMDVLKIKLGVTYYWGEGEADFGSGTKTQPTFPELLGYDDLPVYYDEENDQTLYMRVGTNTELLACSLPDNGGLELMAGSDATLSYDKNEKKYTFNLGDPPNNGDAAMVQISFAAASEAAASKLAKAITVSDANGTYPLVLYTKTVDTEGNLVSSNIETANANLNYDEDTYKATYVFTVTDPTAYNKEWTLTTPENSDVLLYNVAALPAVTKVSTPSSTVSGSSITLNWEGSSLDKLDQISFFLCKDKTISNGPEAVMDPGYRIGVVDDPDKLATDNTGTVGSAALTIPVDVPSGKYYIRAVYTREDEVNGVMFSQNQVTWTNSNAPGAATIKKAKAAGNLQYELTIASDSKTDGYLVTVYNADGTATDFEQVSYEAAETGDTVINVGGSYTAVTQDENGNEVTKTFGLTGGETYTIGVTPYNKVETNINNEPGEIAVYGTEVTKTLALPVMVTPTVTFSADKTAQIREETIDGKTYEMPVYTANALTITAKAADEQKNPLAVTGTWMLDNADTADSETRSKYLGTFTGLSDISIPLTDLAEGEHTLTLTGAAANGDSFGATYTFTVDTLAPQLLLSSPVNGSFFGKNGTLTLTGVVDAGARFTVLCDGETVYSDKTLSSDEFDPVTGTFSFTMAIPNPNSSSQRTLTISVADDVSNTTVPQTVKVSHGGLADLASLEIRVNDLIYTTGNIPVPAAGLSNAALTLVGVTSDGTSFVIDGDNVYWEVSTVEGSASVTDGRLTAAAGSQGLVTGKLAVAVTQGTNTSGQAISSSAYRTAALTFGVVATHTVAVATTVGGTVTGGGGECNPGTEVTLTATPDSGYRFAGWTVIGAAVSDPSAATITFTMPESGNVTVEAAFEPIPAGSSSAGSESVTARAGEVVQVKLPAGESESTYVPCYTDSSGKTVYVPISAVIDGYVTFLAPKDATYRFASNPAGFQDVAGHWAEDSIAFCASRGIFQGVGDNRFAPNAPMNRAMFATVLYRLAGSPAVSGGEGFSDVADDIWYTDAVLWGKATGISTGYGGGLFGPDDPVTREQMCAMLVRWLDYMGYELPAVKNAKTFTDADQFSSWARDPISFAQTSGLINGLPGGAFAPKNNATRAENSAVFQRMILAILSEAQ